MKNGISSLQKRNKTPQSDVSRNLKHFRRFCIVDYSYGDYSKHYITDALFRLMEDYGFKDITVSDIARKAGVGRATFYRYFSSKEDVIRYFFDHTKAEFAGEQIYRPRCKEDYLDIIKRVVRYIKNHKRRLQLLVAAHLEYLYTDYVDCALRKNFDDESPDGNIYKAAGYAGAISNITLSWIKRDCTDDEKEVLSAFAEVCLGTSSDC